MKAYEGEVLNDKYRLVKLLGKGGMGAVYLGQHVVIGKSVAVKFLHAEFAAKKEVVKRFYREAQAAAAIGHDNIIDVMDVGISDEGEPYLVMEYLEGESLAALIKRKGVLDLTSACGIMEPMLQALFAAHSKGIVHRDLKPENVFLAHRPGGAPKVKLIDFGISKVTRSSSGEKLTQTGSVMGTPAYMSPEQARGSGDLDHRADIYSAGVMLYEMLTGALPFTGNNFTEMIVNILTLDPIPPREALEGFPPEIEPIVLRALVKDPAGRYQSTLELLDALRALSVFGSREEGLTKMSAGLAETSYAGGELGDAVTDEDSVAEAVLSDIMDESGYTPTGWAGTRLKTGRRRSKAPLVVLISFLLLGALVGSGVFYYLRMQKDQRATVIPTRAVTQDQKTSQASSTGSNMDLRMPPSVEIKVTGLPAGALMFWNGAVVTGDHVRVLRSEDVYPLRVEAEGFEPLVITVTPSEDKVIDLDLKKKSINKPVSSKRTRSTSRSAKEPSIEPSLEVKKEEVVAPDFKGVELPSEPLKEPVIEATTPPKEEEKKPKTKKGARGTRIHTSFE